ncbi:exocyst complex component Sec5-domain-containing protein [Coniochaeta sp. 2T2.1]|nr:exocyst complex component Sec5-domain-containing protein [Coniochaeta sp. 2T2.1]
MADLDREVLDFYGISTQYPQEWPAEKDNNTDGSDDEDPRTKKLNRRKSKYQALERAVSTRGSIVPGSESSASGVANLVQRDEPDPLGTTDSVVRTLKNMGLPMQEDTRLRNRFLLSSTTFSPAQFLSTMHATADTQQLLVGLDVLSKSIDQKSASLKVLVESNFERFVRAKATIDNVYKEMKYRGADPTPPRSHVRGHSRHASWNSYRGSGGNHVLASPLAPAADPRKKNALIKESDYGVMGIKAPLLDVAAKAEEVWGPALGGQEKEQHLNTVSLSLDKFKDCVEISAAIADSIKRKDHESLVEEYTKARRFADEARKLADNMGSQQPSEEQMYKILLAGRMWHDVDEQIQAFKREVWRRLASIHNAPKAEAGPGQRQDQHMELITLLLELGVEDNPIWVWLLSWYDHLKGKIVSTADRSKVEIEVLRRRLANSEKPTPQVVASHMRTLGRQSIDSKIPAFDSGDIVELWEKMVSFMAGMLSSQGLLGEVMEFWQQVQGFMEGKTQLPTGYKGESQTHHRLSQQGTIDLQKGIVELVDLIREQVFEFFAGPPPEDISLLFSPLPTTPNTPMSATTRNGALSPTMPRDPRFNFDANNLPPPSPKRGEAWEKFAFWPPWSNSVSGVHYLSKMLALVGAGAAELASIAPVRQGDSTEIERLRTLVGAARERCVSALCAAWNKDAENIKFVEDWQRPLDRKDVTRMPATFAAFEGALLTGMQKILYISDAMSKPGAGDIVLPPPQKLLQMVRSQYVTTLYKALSGMVENAERSIKQADDEWTTDVDDFVLVTHPRDRRSSILGGGAAINAGDRNVRMLLTLSNLQLLRSQVVPGLNTQFENAFSVKLTDETKTIRDVLGQIDARLFQSYTQAYVDSLRSTIRSGITAPDWVPSVSTTGGKAREVKPYVYEALLGLVLVHSQVSTTASTLTAHVLSYLLEQASRELLDAFKTRARYNLEALVQATLDVEFVAQTLSQYTTDRASELQSQIYQELDSRTDNDARAWLQGELTDMRAVLKRLRKASENEFACFRKPKRGAGGSVSTAGGSSGAGGQIQPGPIKRTDTGLSDRSL